MARFIRSTILDAHTMATETFTIDLPINPISHLILTMEFLNATDEPTLAEILSFINRVTVNNVGVQILNLESEDLAFLNAYLYGSGGQALAPVATDNQHGAYSLIVPFGRKMYDPTECFPATRRGEFQMTLNTTIPTASLDNAILNVASVEMPGASPTNFLKSTLLSISAPGGIGEHDIDLPIGNDLVAVLLGMTSFPGASEFLFGIDDIRLLVDNIEHNIVSAKAADLAGEMINRIPASVRSTAAQGGLIPNTHIYMDFDPMGDGNWLVETAGKARVHLRANYGVNEAVNVVPLELTKVATLA